MKKNTMDSIEYIQNYAFWGEMCLLAYYYTVFVSLQGCTATQSILILEVALLCGLVVDLLPVFRIPKCGWSILTTMFFLLGGYTFVTYYRNNPVLYLGVLAAAVAAISFAKEFPDTLWCYGNHDLCYLWNERESGYSRAAAYTVRNKLEELKDALPSENQIRYIHRIDDVLFCHGGILQAFVEENVENTSSVDETLAEINAMGPEQLWCSASPIWYRPQDSREPMYGEGSLLQVVGHTPVEKIYRSGNVISCDVFSTYRDGRPIGTQEYPVIDTVKKSLSIRYI